MKRISTNRSFRQTSSLALAIALAVPAAIALPAAAHAQEAQQDFSIPAGDLATALQRYSAATDVQLVYSSDLVSGKRSPGVSGQMSPQQALGQLLSGSGLSARVSGNTATLVHAGAGGDVAASEGERLLGPVRVEGSQGGSYQAPVRGDGIAQVGGIRGGQDQEATGYKANVATISGGAPVALEDIPRSISVQTQDQLQTQDIVSLQGALARMPGVTIEETGSQETSGYNVRSRGFLVGAYQVDGGAPRSLDFAGTLNLDAYERVELVRGPNPLYAGESAGYRGAGGSINLVRKRPGPMDSQSLQLEAGSRGRYGVVADISTPTLFGSPIALRAIASWRQDGSEIDGYSKNTKNLYVIADAPLGEGARLELGLDYGTENTDGEYRGIPRFVEGSLLPVPRQTSFAYPGAFTDVKRTELFAKLYIDVADNWDFQFDASYRTSERRDVRSRFSALLREATGTSTRPFGFTVTDFGVANPSNLDLTARLTGRFDTFGLEHNIVIGMDHGFYDRGATDFGIAIAVSGPSTTLDGLLNPVFAPPAQPQPQGYAYKGDFRSTTGLTLTDTISWRDTILFTTGVRLDHYTSSLTQAPTFEGIPYDFTASDIDDWTLTDPTFSLTVKPVKGMSIYGSYANGFSRVLDLFYAVGEAPNFTFVEAGPSSFENKEIGIKYATAKWIASVSAYDLQLRNVPYPLQDLYICPPSGFNQCYAAGGQGMRSRGIDAEISGEVLPGLNLVASANYGKLVSRTVDPDVDGELPLQSEALAPQLSAQLLLDWQVPSVDGLRLNAAVRYKGKYYNTGTVEGRPFEAEQKAFAVFDLGAEYFFSKELGVRLFVENVTDRQYLSTIAISQSGGNFYGKPRTFLATLLWRRQGEPAFGSNDSIVDRTPFGVPANWYAAFDVGTHFDKAIKATSTDNGPDGNPVRWSMQTEGKAIYDVRIGHYLTDNVRVEVEGQFRPLSIGKVGGSATAPFGLCGNLDGAIYGEPFDCSTIDGKSNQWSLMLNGLYDFGNKDAAFRPFVGAGIGLTRSAIALNGKLDGIGSNDPWVVCFDDFGCFEDTQRALGERFVATDSVTSLTWQLTAGASFKLGDRLRFDATYRYINVEKGKWSSYNFPTAEIERLGDFSSGYKTHAITAGLRWAFGAPK